jgi:hypothetical protein
VEIEWILIIHNNGIFPYYRYSMEIVWIYYGFSGAIANLRVWISLFFPVKSCKGSSSYITLKVISNKTKLIFISVSL